MSELLEKLGIDWMHLVAQALNFVVIAVVLRLTVYKPLVELLRKRKEKIEQGLRDADSAAERMKDAERVFSKQTAEAEKKSLEILAETERIAKEKESAYLALTKEKEKEILKAANERALDVEEKSREKFYGEAVSLVRDAVAKIAEQSPETVDEALVAQAVREVKNMH